MPAESLRPNSSTTAAVDLPTLPWRLIAFAIDIVGYFLLSSPLWYFCIQKSWAEQPVEGSVQYWTTYISFIAYTSTELFAGRSPGKWLFGFSITIQQTQARSFPTFAVRWMVKYLPVHWMTFAEGFGWMRNTLGMGLAVPAVLVGSSLIMAILAKSRQTLHDVCARTIVTRTNYRSAFPAP